MDLRQEDARQTFESLGKTAWTIVCDNWRSDNGHGGIYCAFAPESKRSEAVESYSWNVTKGDFRPGFSQHREGDKWVTTYMSGSMYGDFEPLVLLRNFYGVVPGIIEIVEQFRLYHNLYWDELTSQYMQPHDDGTSSVAARIKGQQAEVRTKLLRQYQAARQLDLLLFIDSILYGDKGEAVPSEMSWSTPLLRTAVFPGDEMIDGRPFTRYLGTRVLTPPPIEKSGIWPFEDEDDHYPEFIIATDEDGMDILHTCNPDALANNFGANPDAPHYLTPVHFRKDVLRKYYDKPELYTVSDGQLNCAALWNVAIDNSAPETVVVFLGDLGRDLPKQERDYWRSYNIPPDSPVSETFIRRAFLAEFAEPTALDLQIRHSYVSLRERWAEHYGWNLFREPDEADAGLLQRLRLPLDESQAEFESSIRILTQLVVDAINESKVQKLLHERRKDEKGISKLQRWLEQEGYPHTDRDIKFLRNLQELRSTGTAHRKGSGYEKTLTKVFGSLRGSAAIKTLFESALAMSSSLQEWATGDSQETVD